MHPHYRFVLWVLWLPANPQPVTCQKTNKKTRCSKVVVTQKVFVNRDTFLVKSSFIFSINSLSKWQYSLNATPGLSFNPCNITVRHNQEKVASCCTWRKKYHTSRQKKRESHGNTKRYLFEGIHRDNVSLHWLVKRYCCVGVQGREEARESNEVIGKGMEEDFAITFRWTPN